jgi:hypothetical protein
MSNCPHTGLTVPECSCVYCIEQQLQRFSPRVRAADGSRHARLLASEARVVDQPPGASKRLPGSAV